MKYLSVKIFLLAITISLFSCSGDGGGVNIFTVEDDMALGQQLHQEIKANPQEYPILDRSQYSGEYDYLENMVEDILNSNDIRYKEEFAWKIYIIDDDVLNAFAAPGGYIYVYSGLIKFLENKDDLAGVLGHEVAHADRRHSTQQLTKQYGVVTLLELLLGENQGLLSNVAASLLGLKFSRDDESEADEYSVVYLCDTDYAANAAASFFEKLQEEQSGGTTPEFLSTHPSPDNRIANINTDADERGCDTSFDSSQQAWENFQNSLP